MCVCVCVCVCLCVCVCVCVCVSNKHTHLIIGYCIVKYAQEIFHIEKMTNAITTPHKHLKLTC